MKEHIYKVANQLPAISSGGYTRYQSNPMSDFALSFLVETEEASLKSFDKLKIKPRRKRA